MIHDSERRNRRRRSSIRMFQVERNMIHNSWFKLWKKDVLWNIFGQSSEIHDSWFTLWNERRELIQDVDLVTYLSDSWFTIQREEIGGGEILEECFNWKEIWFTNHDSSSKKKDVLWNIFGHSSEIHDSWFTLWNERRELIQELELGTYLSDSNDSWFRENKLETEKF